MQFAKQKEEERLGETYDDTPRHPFVLMNKYIVIYVIYYI